MRLVLKRKYNDARNVYSFIRNSLLVSEKMSYVQKVNVNLAMFNKA